MWMYLHGSFPPWSLTRGKRAAYTSMQQIFGSMSSRRGLTASVSSARRRDSRRRRPVVLQQVRRTLCSKSGCQRSGRVLRCDGIARRTGGRDRGRRATDRRADKRDGETRRRPPFLMNRPRSSFMRWRACQPVSFATTRATDAARSQTVDRTTSFSRARHGNASERRRRRQWRVRSRPPRQHRVRLHSGSLRP